MGVSQYSEEDKKGERLNISDKGRVIYTPMSSESQFLRGDGEEVQKLREHLEALFCMYPQ